MDNAYKKLLGYILPGDFTEYFDLVDVTDERRGGRDDSAPLP